MNNEQEILDQFVEMYLSGKPVTECHKELKIGKNKCYRELKIRGIKVRTRIHETDESFFDNIDTEEKAYWLGFISADGCVNKKRLTLNVKKSDEKHLEKFRDLICPTNKVLTRVCITKGKSYLGSYLQINSIKMIKRLNELGIVQAKSLVLQPCKEIPKNLERHYWRGYFDGDGGISYHSKSKTMKYKYMISLTSGSVDMLNAFNDFLSKNNCRTINIYKDKNSNCYQCICGGVYKVREILKTLYHDCRVYLDRKMELYKLASF